MGDIVANYQYWIYDKNEFTISIKEVDEIDQKEKDKYEKIKKSNADKNSQRKKKESVRQDIEEKIKEIEEEIKKLKEENKETQEQDLSIKKLEKEKKDKQNELNKIVEEIHKMNLEVVDDDRKFRTLELKFKKHKEIIEQYECLKDFQFKLARNKNEYTDKETLIIIILKNGVEYGKIVTMRHKFLQDTEKFNEFGVFMPQYYFDDFYKIITDNYYKIKLVDIKYAINTVPEKAVIKFLQSTKEEILENYVNKEDNENKGGKAKKEESFYYVRVDDFNKIFENCSLWGISNKEMREALINYNYAKANTGRNDYHAGKQYGKVIAFYKDKIDSLKGQEEGQDE